MNVLRSAAATLTTAAVAAACLAAGAGTAAAADEAVYTGTATITLAAYDYCDLSSGGRHAAGQDTLTLPVNLTVTAPRSGEDNPLHLTLQTDPAGAPGGFLVTTAQSAATSQGDVLLPFWSVDYDPDSGELSGTLSEDHAEEAFAANQFAVVQSLIPCRPQLGTIPMIDAMAEGAELAGSVDADAAQLEFAGTTTTGMWDYHVTAELTRA